MQGSGSGSIILASTALLLAGVSCCLVLVLMPSSQTPVVQPGESTARDSAEVIALRENVERLAERLSELESRAFSPGDAAEGDRRPEELDVRGHLVAALEEGAPDLDELLAAAVERAGAGDVDEYGKRKERGSGKLDRGDAEKVIQWIDGEVERWAETHSLAPAQVEALNELTRRSVKLRMDAEAAGAGDWELTELDVSAQAEVRRIVGDHVYIATERLRLTQKLRGWVPGIAGSVGGLSQEQHTQLDQIIDSSVESRVHDVVRLRSEPMPEDEHSTLTQGLKEQEGQTWRTIRDQVLTDTQRARMPGK